MHYIVGIEIEIDHAGKPLLRDAHRADSTAQYGDAVLEAKAVKTLD